MPKEKIDKNLKVLIKTVEKEFGNDLLMIPELGIGITQEDLEYISTGSGLIDGALGVGGLPRGRVVEIYGSESSGKTTLALSVINQAQRKGLMCGYIDTEQALDKVRMGQLGVKFDRLAISQPNNAEEALDLLEMMILSKAFGVIVLDSVAALVPKAELEGDMSDSLMGVQARLMGKILRKITPSVKKNNVLVIFINQVRQKIGGYMPFPMEVTSGGNALKFYATIRIDMRRIRITKTKNPISEHKVTIKKNKLAIPAQVVKPRINEGGFME